MNERLSLPFKTPHETHTETGPVEIFFGMTYERCNGEEYHEPHVVITAGEDQSFSSAGILFEKDTNGVYVPSMITTFGTTWRDSIVRVGLSHVNSGLPDQLSVEEIYIGVLRGLSKRMAEKGSPRFLKSLQQDALQKPRIISTLPRKSSNP